MPPDKQITTCPQKSALGVVAVLLAGVAVLTTGVMRGQTNQSPEATTTNTLAFLVAHTKTHDDPAPVIAFDDLELTNTLVQLAKLVELDIQFDPALSNLKTPGGPRVCDIKVTEKWREITPLQAMQALLDNFGLQPAPIPGSSALRIIARDPNLPGTSVTTVNLTDNEQRWGAATTNMDEGYAVAGSVSFDNLELPNAIRQLAMLANLNIQFDPALLDKKAADGTPVSPPHVTKKWMNVSARQALQALLDQYGWRMTLTEGDPILRVTTKKP